MSQLVLTPREIVAELDRYIVGQQAAKRAVAIALRTRWRRQQLPEEMRREVTPANLILIGPTGVGKTEIARRLARLASAPFVKVEASKFTEVGYVGRDVDSIVRDLVEAAIGMVRAERSESVKVAAQRVRRGPPPRPPAARPGRHRSRGVAAGAAPHAAREAARRPGGRGGGRGDPHAFHQPVRRAGHGDPGDEPAGRPRRRLLRSASGGA